MLNNVKPTCRRQRHGCMVQMTLDPSIRVNACGYSDMIVATIKTCTNWCLQEYCIRSFHVHFSIGTLCLLKSVSSTRCLQRLQASQLIWSTKPWHSSGKGWRPLLDICWRTEEKLFTHDICACKKQEYFLWNAVGCLSHCFSLYCCRDSNLDLPWIRKCFASRPWPLKVTYVTS